MIGKFRNINIQDQIRAIFNSKMHKYSFEECFDILGYCIPEKLVNITKTKNSDDQLSVKLTMAQAHINEALAEIIPEILDSYEKMILIESQTMTQILVDMKTSDDWAMYSNYETPIRHHNLI